MTTKFEAGKKYIYKDSIDTDVYECLYAGNQRVLLRDEDENEFAVTVEYIERFNEVKPKLVYERWINIYISRRSFI